MELPISIESHSFDQFATVMSAPDDVEPAIESAMMRFAASSPEVPFWPQMPKLSDRESIVGQGLGVLSHLIEPRRESISLSKPCTEAPEN